MTNEVTKSSGRPYRKRRRAEQEAETRRRIVDAAVKLHGTVGPARTTVSGVAKEAGVQRATVYRHFPDEESLFASCSARFWQEHPLPDPTAWREIADPSERLRTALTEIYDLYGRTEAMLEKTSRDAPLVDAIAGPMEAFLAYIQAVADVLLAGRSERGEEARLVPAAIGHALWFSTWQSLVRQQGLEPEEAVELMVSWVDAAGRVHGLQPPTPGAR